MNSLSPQNRCQLLEMQLQRRDSDMEGLKQRLSHLQDRFDQSTAEFEQRLDLARDKERQLISVLKDAFLVFLLGY